MSYRMYTQAPDGTAYRLLAEGSEAIILSMWRKQCQSRNMAADVAANGYRIVGEHDPSSQYEVVWVKAEARPHVVPLIFRSEN